MIDEFLSQPGGWIGLTSFLAVVIGWTGLYPDTALSLMVASCVLVFAVSVDTLLSAFRVVQ